ncbi:MAG: cupin domain-containing protein [Rhodoferax sp.]|nr:cupin domain-containing protein [Rhodoferax sp.]
MNIDQPLQLLGGLSPALFMSRHWQKKPLVIRQAIPGLMAPIDRAELFDLAAQDDVQSRLVIQTPADADRPWRLKQGPFGRKALPALKQPGWTLLVQSVDLHDARARALRDQFRFVPDARLDDVMVSYASDGGGVGPHFDSYDVFLLQAHGQRRWRIGRQKNLDLQPGMPLKILADFTPEQEFVLQAGDMLYLPPRYAHDGVALGECMTYSIGFRAPGAGELAQEILQRFAEQARDEVGDTLYRDPKQVAQADCAKIPADLTRFAQESVEKALQDPLALQRALGEYLSEPKAQVWFDSSNAPLDPTQGVCLDRRTQMLYDAAHIFINGESFLASGRDATLMSQLADQHRLSASDIRRLSAGALELLAQWFEDGWLQMDQQDESPSP